MTKQCPRQESPPFASSRLCCSPVLLPNDLDQHPLAPAAVELAVEDLLPRAEVELALGDGHDDLAAHDLPLQVGVGVVLAGAVVVVVLRRRVAGPASPASRRSRACRPGSSSLMKTLAVMCMALTRHQALLHAALADELLDLSGDVDEVAPVRRFEPEVFGERFHAVLYARRTPVTQPGTGCQ